MMNMGSAMKLMGAWNKFKSNHPKFPAFCKAVARKGFAEDTIIEVAIISPDGERIETNVRLTQEDLELMNELKNMSV